MSNDSWRDTYDNWKLRSPDEEYGTEPEPEENNFRYLYELLSAKPERFPSVAEHHRGTLLEALRLAAEQMEAQEEYEQANV